MHGHLCCGRVFIRGFLLNRCSAGHLDALSPADIARSQPSMHLKHQVKLVGSPLQHPEECYGAQECAWSEHQVASGQSVQTPIY